MAREHVHTLLDRIGVIRNRCDLDVLVYLFRHADALLTGERLAAAVGYDLKQVAGSLDTLVFGGLLKRTRSRADGLGMYVFGPSRTEEGALASLLQMATSRAGRLEILRVLGRWAPPEVQGRSVALEGDELSARDTRKG